MSRMLEYLPTYERSSKVFQEIMRVEEIEFDKVDLDIKDLEKQLSIDTATWGLVIYERELGIKTNTNKTLEERRSIIKSKWRGTGKVDIALIKMVADAWANGDCEITFDGKIHIKFNSIYGIPSNLRDLESAIDEIKPAHLRILYYFAYLLIRDIHNVKSLAEMEEIQLNKFAGGEV